MIWFNFGLFLAGWYNTHPLVHVASHLLGSGK